MSPRHAAAVLLVLAAVPLDAEEPARDGVRFRGNDRCTPEFLRRAGRIEPGGAWTPERAEETHRLLMNTRLFQDVKVTPRANGADIDFEERWTLGVYPDFTHDGDRTTFGLGVEEINLLGEGKRLGARGWGGDDGEGGTAWFADPWAFGPDIFYDVDVAGGRWFDRYYDNDGNLLAENEVEYFGGDAGGGVRLGSRARVWGGLGTRDEDLDILKGNTPTETGRFNLVRLGAAYDTTAYRIDHIEGWRAWTRMERGTHALGGEFAFRKTGAGGGWAKRPWRDRDHLLLVDAGAWRGAALPFREFFALGGQGSLRGYRVGAFRGTRLVTWSAEYQVPFWHPQLWGYNADVAAAGFVDGGLLWAGGETPSPGDAAWGAGFGLRVASREFSFAGCRFDLGYGFETHEFLAYFSFGPVF